ncbi:MAG: CRTAC1 family protein [Marinicellaceae bacterium]
MKFIHQKLTKSILLTVLIIIFSSCKEYNSDSINKPQIFVDMSDATGLNFKHYNGMDGHTYAAEILGSAVALFDFDNDGDLDIYLGQGNQFTEGNLTSNELSGVLYQNDLIDGKVNLIDITKESGLISDGYSMGVAVGDINNDGYADIYLSNYGNNQMFLNLGNGQFKDITDTSKTNDDNWSVSSAFFDMNGDNLLDLYVTNYFDFNLATHKTCYNSTGREEYCGPASYPHLSDSLFKNLGNGVFANYSVNSNVTKKAAGLGVVTGDYNEDGMQDVFVTNDMGHNFLWINQGDDSFIDDGLLRGSAVNKHGIPEASMGVDAGDIDNDGDLDIFMTHLLNETNTFYLNNGQGFFKDATSIIGLSEPSKGFTGFGTAFLDFDNDGWLDLIAVNGEVRKIQEQIDKGVELPLAQSNQLFQNIQGKFTEITSTVNVLNVEKVSRGIAIGDIDNDGDSDVIITNNNDVPELLINQVGNMNNWIGLNLIAKNGKYMLGSTAIITLENGKKLTRRTHTDASYISANDPRILLGLDNYNKNLNVTVNWTDGKVSEVKALSINEYHNIYYPE